MHTIKNISNAYANTCLNPCSLVSLGLRVPSRQRTDCVSQQQNRNHPMSFKLVFYKQTDVLKCWWNKCHKQSFVTASCVPTGVKTPEWQHRGEHRHGAAEMRRQWAFADASQIAEQTGQMPSWRSAGE